MSAETCTWRNWQTTVEWDEDTPPGIKIRLGGFFDRMLPMLDMLARRVDGAIDTDAIAALSGQLQQLGPMPSPWADDTLTALHAWSTAIAEEARVTRHRTELEAALEGEPASVGWAAVAVLLERILRATLASRYELLEDPDGVLMAADVLEHQVRQVLVFVCTGQVSAADYRTM
jgi:hypothetical protein